MYQKEVEKVGKFICPVCRGKLVQSGNTYRCKRGHSYDISAAGYVHLLPANHMNSKIPGDNKQMVAARRDFLKKGYYQPISQAVNERIAQYCKDKGKDKEFTIADVGCGEGYYTNHLAEFLQEKQFRCQVIGMDISKFAVASAAKSGKQWNVEYGVASLFDLPLKDHSCHVLLNMFAPVCIDEFHRVLKRNGLLLFAVASTLHLWGLKEKIYDNPYENEKTDHIYEGFAFVDKTKVKTKIQIPCQEDIDNLFTMTPYYYKSSVETTERVHQLGTLETEIDVDIIAYRAL